MEVSDLVSVLSVVSVSSVSKEDVMVTLIVSVVEAAIGVPMLRLLCVLLREFNKTAVAVGIVPSQVATQYASPVNRFGQIGAPTAGFMAMKFPTVRLYSSATSKQYSPALATCHLVQPVMALACVLAGGAAVAQVESVSGDCPVVEAAASAFAVTESVDFVSEVDAEELVVSGTDELVGVASGVARTPFTTDTSAVDAGSELVTSISSVEVCVTLVVRCALEVPVPIVYVSVVTVVCVRMTLSSGGPTV